MTLSCTFYVFSVTAIVIFLLVWTVFVQQSSSPDAKTFDSTCNVPERHIRNLHVMVHAAHEILDGLDLVHFLCYGSLFGQIRNSASLPWERDAEMCLLNEEVAKFDEVFVKRAFWKRGLDVVYDSAEGRYIVSVDRRNERKAANDDDDDDEGAEAARLLDAPESREKEEGEGDLDELEETVMEVDRDFRGVLQLVVFAVDKNIEKNGEAMYHRIGWKRRLLPPDCDYSKTLECFPARLAHTPLPLKLFGPRAVPVPREEFEILKAHFPDNWWKEVKPLNC